MMNRRFLCSLACTALCAVVAGWLLPAQPPASRPAIAQQSDVSLPASQGISRMPLSFEANQGQTDAVVRFMARGDGYQLFLTADEAVLNLRSREKNDLSDQRQLTNPPSAVLRMRLANANAAPQIAGEGELPGKANYLLGNDARRWRGGVPTYTKVRAHEVYPGVDLVYYGNQRQLEYEFILAPGAFQPNRAGGNDGTSDAFITKFNPAGGVTYSTYLGGIGNDQGNDIAIDSAGNAYVTGSTQSTNFPTQNPVRPNLADSQSTDAFITKLNATGSGLIYSTYLGGVGNDQGNGIALASGSRFRTAK